MKKIIKNILIVDDDPFLLSLYRKTLEREGFNILTAVDGADALEMLSHGGIDLVVLDLMLPKIHGLKVLEIIRADEVHKDLPVLILSNAYLQETAKLAMKAKATAGILKSECSPLRLVKMIRTILQPGAAEVGQPAPTRNSWFSNLLGGKAGEARSKNGLTAETASAPVAPETSEKEAAEPASATEVRNGLLQSWSTDITMIRSICLRYVKTVGTQEGEENLKHLYRRLRLLGARATIGELTNLSHLCNALEAMLFEHGFNLKRNMSSSVIQTMIQAVDCLEFLFKSQNVAHKQSRHKNRILLVDDDPVCNMANEIALKRANFDTVCASDGVTALALLENKAFDLILLDITMPVLDGFEVCEKIRRLPSYAEVPIIFVTINDDFQSRAKSVLSGSNGLITKPISPLELIVKALVHLLRSQESGGATDNSSAKGVQPSEDSAKLAHQAGRIKSLKATHAAVESRVNTLSEALGVETKRREEAEKKAAANLEMQSQLEKAQDENKKAQHYLQQKLEESQREAEKAAGADAWKLNGRKRAMESVRNFVEGKNQNLSKVLAEQVKRSEKARQLAVEYARQNAELEAALAEIQQAKENLLREIAAVGEGQMRGDLETALLENQQHQADLLQKIEKTRQNFQTRQETDEVEQSKTGAQKQNLEGDRAADEAQIKMLTEALAVEKQRSETAEQNSAGISQQRSTLEAELAKSKQIQEQLRAELVEQQRQLAAQLQSQNMELGHFTTRMKELETAQAALTELKTRHSEVAEQVEALHVSLKAESTRRTSAEQKATELAARRAELESELAQRTQAQEKLSAELAAQQQRLDAQVQTHQGELANQAERAKELETTQAALAALKTQHTDVSQQVQTLTKSLQAESSRRTSAEQKATELAARRAELESELAQRTQAQEQLRAELAGQQQQLEAQTQTHKVSRAHLALRTKDLEVAQAALASLQAQHADVNQLAKSLTESLSTEAGRRETAVQQVAELTTRRTELESELARRTQAQEKLSAELAEQQQRLDAQVQTHQGELGRLAERTRELDAAQLALAELKTQHDRVSQQAQTLTKSLSAESDRRQEAEQAVAKLNAQRVKLEQAIVQHIATQERLHAQLTEQQQRLDAQTQQHNVALGKLAERTQELETAQAELAKLKAEYASVAQHVPALNEQVRSLKAALQTESGHRSAAEKQAVELAERRSGLETELAGRTQAQAQLRSELAQKQKQLDAQVQAHQVELGHLAGRTQELEVAQAALAKLQAQHATVSERVESLTKSLQGESARRTASEKRAAELIVRRGELEQELAERTQNQAQLHEQLVAKGQQIENLARELEVQRQQAQADALHQQQMGEQMARSEHSRADLARQLNAAQERITERESAIRALENDLQEQRAEQDRLDARFQSESKQRGRLEAQLETMQAELAETTSQLAQKCAAEQVWLGRESELQSSLRNQQKEMEKASAALTVQAVEIHQARTQMEQFELHRTALIGEVQNVTGQMRSLKESLTVETSRREAIERQVADLAHRRQELELELDKGAAAEAQLRTQLAGLTQTHEAELGNLAQRTQELAAAQLALREAQAQNASRAEEIRRLTESIAAEVSQREAAEQAWQGREAELQAGLAQQQNELAKSGASLAVREAEVQNTRKQITELQVLQSALCGKIQALTSRGKADAKQIQELQSAVALSESAVTHAEQKLAGLNYAILDASRMNLRLQRERVEKDQQHLEGLRGHLAWLSQTPLSLAQRGLLADLQQSIDSLKNSRAGTANPAGYPVDLPCFRDSEFDFSEVTESAFNAVRAAAKSAGVALRASAVDTTSLRLRGCAEQIHQLITLLAISPLTLVTGVTALDLRVAIKPKCVRVAEITLRVALSSDHDALEFLRRLEAVTASTTLHAGSGNEAEMGLAAGWQLARALGAGPSLEIDDGREVCIVLLLPIAMVAQTPATAAGRPTLESQVHGHDVSSSNGSQNGTPRIQYFTDLRGEYAADIGL